MSELPSRSRRRRPGAPRAGLDPLPDPALLLAVVAGAAALGRLGLSGLQTLIERLARLPGSGSWSG